MTNSLSICNLILIAVVILTVSRSEGLPDQPLQLVKPDPNGHEELIIVKENVRHLRNVKGAVAVVAVVGKYHSGKSFLLNQLMGKQNKAGFGVGPTVKPKTMGIWMWGKPQVIDTPNGQSLSVIYLDTEGFAASNVSEVYDAKIFAIATILSSYLIFNSVKIIDQGEIDYLDTLAKRTRLFTVKSQLMKLKYFDDFNYDLLTFPPLTWVIQDFVQKTDEETPQEWLHRIMTSTSKDSEHHNISILEIFESVNCHTMFLPATKKALLQDLSLAKEKDLTEEYRKERDHLVRSIHKSLTPKEKNSLPINGTQIAYLLEVLVNASNEGSFAKVPGQWKAMVKHVRDSSVQECIKIYDSEMNILLEKHNQGAINSTKLYLWNQQSYEKAKKMLDELLLGFDQSVTINAQEELQKTTNDKFENYKINNDWKIEQRFSEARKNTELKVKEALKEVKYPLKVTQLQLTLNGIRNKFMEQFRNQIFHLSGHSTSYKEHSQQLKDNINHIFNGAVLKNKEAMEAILNKALDKAVVVFRREANNPNQIPRLTNVLNKLLDYAEKAAKKVFNEESKVTHEEDIYGTFLGKFKSTIQEELLSVKLENEQLIVKRCKSKVEKLVTNFKRDTDPEKLSFPMNEAKLNERLKAEEESAFKAYAETNKGYSDTMAFAEVKKQFNEEILMLSKKRRDQNYKAYIKEVETPLETAKKQIKLSASKYDTPYSFQNYMETACLLQLDDGKAQKWSKSLKMSVITRYLDEQSDLQKLLNSKRGWWASVKGFFQYLLNIVYG